jgi:CheY-like chemotaxis protein
MADSLQDEVSTQVKVGGTANQGNGDHVLYVDDDASLVYLVTCILEGLSYRVTGCTDPAKALEMFRSDPKAFQAVVSDLSMPGMSGIEFAQELLRIRPDIPILVTSGDVRPEDAVAVRNLDLPDLVLKPCRVDELGKLLDNLLTRARVTPRSSRTTATQTLPHRSDDSKLRF